MEHNEKMSEMETKDPFKTNPTLISLKIEAERMTFGTVKYWSMRCTYLEKCLDTTRSIDERSYCRTLYLILQKREQ